MSYFTGFLRQARLRNLDKHPAAESFANRYFSGTTYSLWHAAKDLTGLHSRGLVLDAGSGRGAWAHIIEQNARRESLDIAPKDGEQVTWIADLASMPEVPTARYDAAICHQVMEHVADPAGATRELLRILKPGGILVISVPHLSRQHELPHDYFRFTPQGLDCLLKRAGFEVRSVTAYGGVLSFLHHQFATVVIALATTWRPLHAILAALNAPLSVVAAKLDNILDRQKLLAVGVIGVAAKPQEAPDV